MFNLESKVKFRCEQIGLSVKKLSEQIEMSEQNLYRCFKRNSIETKHLENLAQVLGVSLGYFFGEDEPSNITINSKNVNGVVTNNGTVHFSNLQEAEKEIHYLKEKLAERDAQIDSLQKDKDFLQQLIKPKQ